MDSKDSKSTDIQPTHLSNPTCRQDEGKSPEPGTGPDQQRVATRFTWNIAEKTHLRGPDLWCWVFFMPYATME